MVNIETYRWKNMIGPRDQRPPYRGFWFSHSGNGWGIVDFMDFCRAAGFLCIPAFTMSETPQDMADFVEYANSPATSEWGRRRARDGRSESYHLRYIQFGNEESVDEQYWQRFKPMAEAIWQKDPNITVVVGDFAYGRPINELERLGDDVPVVCSANCLQPYRQNENGWDQGLLFLDPSRVWAQPPCYVTRMVSAHYLPLRLETTVRCPDQTLDVTAKRSEDGRTVVLSVVNMASQPIDTRIEFAGRPPQGDTASVTTLTGPLGAINTPEEPLRVVPARTTASLSKDADGRQFVYTFPAHSFTILKME